MAKSIKAKITELEIRAVGNAGDILSAMCGGMDESAEKEFKKTIQCIDRFLKRNGYKRVFN